jgi:NADH pyrophosphatase NudC (nudix superfamily)
MSRILRAAELARSRSTQVPFGNSFETLQNLLQHQKTKLKPIILVDGKATKATSLLCSMSNNKQFLLDEQSLPKSLQLSTPLISDLVQIHILDEIPKDFKSLSTRALTSIHIGDPIPMAYIAHITTMLDSIKNSKFCSRCGYSRVYNQKICSNCKLEKYPRLSPCAIVFVYDRWADSVLLGLKTGGKWSLLAGFCEPIETIEDCAVREVFEESAVVLDRGSVHVAVTQPWPFFSERFEGTSLMMGCFAETRHPKQIPKAQIDELDDVRWFSCEEIVHRWHYDQESLPMNASMARFLMQAFIDSNK